MEQTPAVAAPSAVVEIDRGPLVNMTSDQRADFRRTGELPEAPKPEEPAPSSSEAPKAETSTASEAEKTQQEKKPKPTAEERIAQLEATIEKIRKGAGIDKTHKVESSPAKVEQSPSTRTKPAAEDKDKDGNPKYKTYEDFVEDLADWKAEQRWTTQHREQQQHAQRQELQSKIAEAKQRYGEKFDEVLAPAVNTIMNDQAISAVVKSMLNDSEVLPDLIFTIGSDPKELESFLEMAKSSPGRALRYIALTESLIREELTGKTAPKDPPAKPQTSAPKPPAEVGGRAATPGDALESAAKAGDFRSYKTEANRRELARLKG